MKTVLFVLNLETVRWTGFTQLGVSKDSRMLGVLQCCEWQATVLHYISHMALSNIDKIWFDIGV